MCNYIIKGSCEPTREWGEVNIYIGNREAVLASNLACVAGTGESYWAKKKTNEEREGG